VFPGEFRYGGGHVIQDLAAGKTLRLRAESYGTDCYPLKKLEKEVTLKTLPECYLFTAERLPELQLRVNLSEKTIYTYMGSSGPRGERQLLQRRTAEPPVERPPLSNHRHRDADFSRGGQGFIVWRGTQHNPNVKRGRTRSAGRRRDPLGFGGPEGDELGMARGGQFPGDGCTLVVGLGFPSPSSTRRSSSTRP